MPSGPIIGKEFVLEIPNRPGELRKVTQALSKERVNINGLLCAALGDSGTVRFVPDNFETAERALRTANVRFQTREVVIAPIPNTPGEIDRRLGKLADAGVNLESVYPVLTKEGPSISFESDNASKVQELLRTV